MLTASGGPFRGRTPRRARATSPPSEALAHPTWDMGPVVTINSATLVNKGLEVIEAHLLFDMPVRPHRRRGAPAVGRPLDGRVRRRLDAGPGEPAGHAAADRARRSAGPTGCPAPRRPCDWTTARTWELRAARRRGLPGRTAGARRPGERGGTAPGRLQRGERGVRRGASAPAGCRSSASSTPSSGCSTRHPRSTEPGHRRSTVLDRGGAGRATRARSSRARRQALIEGVLHELRARHRRLRRRHPRLASCLHEAGHLLTAKRFGMKVTAVLRRLRPDALVVPARRDRVRRQGDPGRRLRQDRRDDPAARTSHPADETAAFWRYPLWQRTVVLVAGSATHFVLAIVIFYFAAFATGLPNPARVVRADRRRSRSSARSPTAWCRTATLDQGRPARTAGPATRPPRPRPPACSTATGSSSVDGTPVHDVRRRRRAPSARARRDRSSVTYVRDGVATTATVDLVPRSGPPLDRPRGAGSRRPSRPWASRSRQTAAILHYGPVGGRRSPRRPSPARSSSATFTALVTRSRRRSRSWSTRISGSTRDPARPDQRRRRQPDRRRGRSEHRALPIDASCCSSPG